MNELAQEFNTLVYQMNKTDKDPQENTQNTNTTQENKNFTYNDYIGTIITETKEDNIFRVYSGNPRGLSVTNKGGDWSEYLEEMNRMQADVVCLFEINLDTTKTKVQSSLHDSARSIFDHYRLKVTSSTIPSKNDFKPGGCAIISINNISGRVITTGDDLLGRWCYQTLGCKNNRKLTIISAYQVCQQEIKEGNRIKSLTATVQQISMLRQQGRDITPRQAFIQDLRKFIKSQRESGNGILLIGDFNEELEVSYDGMTKLVADFGLTDLMWTETGTDNFGTNIEGTTRIDYALADEWVQDALVNGCYEPFQFRTKGDHRNMILDFDENALFGNPTYHIDTPSGREFSCKDIKANRIFIEHRHEYMTSHNYGARNEKLQLEWSPELAEQMDRDQFRACKFAAKKCKKKPNVAFINKLANLRKKKNILRRIISEYKLSINLSRAIAHQAREGHDFDIPNNLQDCQAECNKTQ